LADLSDVELALATIVTSAIYPNGATAASAIVLPGGVNPNCRIFPGWPDPTRLDADMAASIINVSIFAQPGLEKNITAYPQVWVSQTKVASTITATVASNVVTIGGSITVGHYITLLIAGNVFSYAAKTGDTLASFAASLAALINGAAVSGESITIPNGGWTIVARAAAPGTAFRELERTRQRFVVTVWAENNAARIATARVIRPALAAIDTLFYPDTSCGRIFYENSMDVDRSGKQSLSCRDIFYWAEYPTTQSMVAYPITSFGPQIEADGWSSPDFTPLPWSSFTPVKVLVAPLPGAAPSAVTPTFYILGF